MHVTCYYYWEPSARAAGDVCIVAALLSRSLSLYPQESCCIRTHCSKSFTVGVKVGYFGCALTKNTTVHREQLAGVLKG